MFDMVCPVMFGLPNTVGTFGWDGSGFVVVAEGVFSGIAKTASSSASLTTGNTPFKQVKFDPSTVSAEYVNNAVLQPSALQALVCIKS